MQIDIKKTAGGSFIVQLGEAYARLDESDLKNLLLTATRALSDEQLSASGDETITDLVERLAQANDVGVQVLMGRADHDDIVTLLKAAESSKATLTKLYNNMSKTARKVCEEDVRYRFRDTPPPAVFGEAARRLRHHIRDMVSDGVRLFS